MTTGEAAPTSGSRRPPRRGRAVVLAVVAVVAFLHAQIWIANHVLGMEVPFDTRTTGTLLLLESPVIAAALVWWWRRRKNSS